MAMQDFFDQAVLTALVRRNLEAEAQGLIGQAGTENFSGYNIFPLVDVQSRKTRIRIVDVIPHGLGQFKAPNATPPLFKPRPVLREQLRELILLEEMEPFDYEEWLKLHSNDLEVRNGTMLSMVERLTILQNRNENLTQWMIWEAAKGQMLVTYPDDSAMVVDYGFDSSHLPVAPIPWTDLDESDPVEDLNSFAQIGADDAGQYYTRVHLNTNTWKLIQRNKNLEGYLSPLGRQLMLATEADVQQLLDNQTTFVRVDSGWLPENATNRRLTKFIPDNRVLMTTSYVLNGQRIADCADGQVLVNVPGRSEPVVRQGKQSELISNPFSKQVFRRQASARIPRIYLPEAFLYATVG